MSTANVTSLYFSSISPGNSLYVPMITLDGLVLVIPFRDPRFGPSISSAHIMFAFVMVQFSNILFSTYLILFSTRPSNYVLYGPGFACVRVLFNCIFILMLSTVCTRTCSFPCLTSEKNSPFLEGLNIRFVPSDLCTTNPAIVELSYVTLYFSWTLCRDRIFAMPSG